MEWQKKFMKAVTFSYDDGVEQDIRLIEILNKCGLKCTFNLNSGLDYEHGTWRYDDKFDVHRLNLDEIKNIYKGHEIAVHGKKHLCLTDLDPDKLHTELSDDAAELYRIFGEKPVGMAYAYGAYNDYVAEKLRSLGIMYGRTVNSSYNFDVQNDLMRFQPTCHHDDDRLFDLAEKFLESDPDVPQIFYIWGHSYEFEGKNNWDRFERFCSLISGKNDIFYGTNRQVLLNTN